MIQLPFGYLAFEPNDTSFTDLSKICIVLGRLRFHDNEDENEFLCADIIICCVPPRLLFVIVVADDEMEAMSRFTLCVQKRNENDSDISLSFSLSFSLSSVNLNFPTPRVANKGHVTCGAINIDSAISSAGAAKHVTIFIFYEFI